MEKKMTGADMETRFNPQAIEADLYKAWEESGAFTAHRVEGKKPFTIVMPPPNITGQLHMGHAMDCILQDAPIRYHRMKGDPTLWLPGTDHAAIATEVRIVETMRKEGLTKKSIGREAFLERAWNWKRNTADALCTSSAKWAFPATGAGNGSPWTRAAAKQCAKCLYACMRKD